MALIEVNHFWPNGLGNTPALPAPFRPSQASITAFCGNINKDHNLKLRFSTSCTWSLHSGIRSGQNEESSRLQCRLCIHHGQLHNRPDSKAGGSLRNNNCGFENCAILTPMQNLFGIDVCKAIH